MANIVEVTLAFSKNLPDNLLYLLLTNPLTYELIKIGVVERRVLAYAEVDYDIASQADYVINQTSAYPYQFFVNGDYLYCNHVRLDNKGNAVGFDNYRTRINWAIDNNYTIGAYPNSIIHQAMSSNPLVTAMRYLPLFGSPCWYDNTQTGGIKIIDPYNNVGYYFPNDLSALPNKEAYFSFVITDEALVLAYTTSAWMINQQSGFYLDQSPLTITYKNGEKRYTSAQMIYQGKTSQVNNDLAINVKIESVVKANSKNYVARLTPNNNLIQSVNESTCYVYNNGVNPSGWDRRVRYFHEGSYTDMDNYDVVDGFTVPKLINQFPAFALTKLALSSYQLYNDNQQGFWKDHRYTEETDSA